MIMSLGVFGLVIAIALAFATPIAFFLIESNFNTTEVFEINSSLDYKDKIEKSIFLEKDKETKIQLTYQGLGHINVIITDPLGKQLQYGDYQWGKNSKGYRELYFTPQSSGKYLVNLDSVSNPAAWVESITVTYPKNQSDKNSNSFQSDKLGSKTTHAIYQNPLYGFSISYPADWKIDSRIESFNGITELVYFTPNMRTYQPSIFVAQLNDGSMFDKNNFKEKYSDLQGFENTLKEICINNDYFHFTCEDYETIEKKIFEIDGQNYYQITHQWKQIWSDGFEEEIVRVETVIPDSDYQWEITLYASADNWLYYLDEYSYAVKSFQIHH